ncbi:hypothetical protein [Marinomonas primoryensis]|uniref:hypothetical protein n=1 Tax=Marinomonas primoryensis TaxID=178399 RepID=UPI00370371A6
MAFRADEEKQRGHERALDYLVPKDGSPELRDKARNEILSIIEKHGPVIDSYPSWHPLVSNHNDRYPETSPSNRCGYKGLDHTILLAHGFITCPYHSSDELIESVYNFPYNSAATITAKRTNIPLYHSTTESVLVVCEWAGFSQNDGMIPKSIAIPLMLEKEIPNWRWSEVGETWESMRPYFLGQPYGSRSSLFVSQETGQAMKTIWNAIINTGMYGPIRV